jgi:hypothetical protein
VVDAVVVVVFVTLSVIIEMGSAGEAVEIGTIGCSSLAVGSSFSGNSVTIGMASFTPTLPSFLLSEAESSSSSKKNVSSRMLLLSECPWEAPRVVVFQSQRKTLQNK